MAFTRKLRNEVGAKCARWAGFRNNRCRFVETLGFIIFVYRTNFWSGWWWIVDSVDLRKRMSIGSWRQ